MTVRVTTLKGASAGRYYTEHLPSYYLDGDEPPGRWWGQGAGLLGLDGDVDAEAFLALMAGRDPATDSDLGRRYGEGSVRFWPLPKGSSASSNSVRCMWRISVAKRSRPPPITAKVEKNIAWRSLGTTCVDMGSTPKPSDCRTSASISGPFIA